MILIRYAEATVDNLIELPRPGSVAIPIHFSRGYRDIHFYQRAPKVTRQEAVEVVIFQCAERIGGGLVKCFVPWALRLLEKEVERWNGQFYVTLFSELLDNYHEDLSYDFIEEMGAAAPDGTVWADSGREWLSWHCLTPDANDEALLFLEHVKKGTVREQRDRRFKKAMRGRHR